LSETVKRISTKRGTRYVKVLESGQYRFITKAAYDTAKGKKTARKTSASKKVTKMARKKPKFRIPLLATIPAAVVGIHIVRFPGNAMDKLNEAQRIMTGFDIRSGRFEWGWLKYGLFPIIGGLIASRLVSKFRLQPRWPYVRL